MSESTSRARIPQGAPTSPYYLWQVAGKPVSVGISMEVIDRLERAAVETFRSIDARGSEIGGLLLGNSSPGSPSAVYIEEFEAIQCDYSRGPLYRLSDADGGRFDAAIERQASSGLQVVGFFRSHTRRALGLDSEDITLMEARFRDPLQVALLVRPFATRASSAGIFIWEAGTIRGDASYLEFPFQSAQLTPYQAESAGSRSGASPAAPAQHKPVTRAKVIPMTSRLEIAAPDPAATRPVILPPAPEPPKSVPEPPKAAVEPPKMDVEPPKPAATEPPATAPAAPEPPQSKSKPSAPESPAAPPPEVIAEAPRFASVASDPFEALQPAPSRSKKLWLWAAVAVVVLACSGALFMYPGLLRKQARPMVPLTLRIERTASDLLLTWNRDSDVIRNARRAVLSIYDGGRQENFDMDLSQLRNGSIVYSPLTADVSFKMELTGADQTKIASEMVRVLSNRPSPMDAPGAAASVGNTTPQVTQPASPVRPVESAAETAEQESVAPTRAVATRAFNADSLSQRLRPALPAEVPDAPALTPSASAVASMNLGVIVPSKIAAPSRNLARTGASGATGSGRVQASQLRPAEVISRTDPVYPPLARRAGASGQVRVSAVIGTDGKVKNVKALSGHPLLQAAAIEAVKQWVYRPTMLNGVAVESQSEVMLTFSPQR